MPQHRWGYQLVHSISTGCHKHARNHVAIVEVFKTLAGRTMLASGAVGGGWNRVGWVMKMGRLRWGTSYIPEAPHWLNLTQGWEWYYLVHFISLQGVSLQHWPPIGSAMDPATLLYYSSLESTTCSLFTISAIYEQPHSHPIFPGIVEQAWRFNPV